MKRIQKIIPIAIDIAGEILYKEGGIDREFNGYISSFGASVTSAGLLPSIIFYSQKGDKASERHKIILCIEAILKRNGYSSDFNLLRKVKTLYETGNRQSEIDRLTENIYDATIALKLAIRTYPKQQKNK